MRSIGQSCLFAAACVTFWSIPHLAPAAIVGYTNYAAWQMASFGTEIVNDFDSGTGSLGTITDPMFGNTTFSNSNGQGLGIWTTDGMDDDTVSPFNYVGSNNVLSRELEDAVITVEFTTPRSAVGVFVIHDVGMAPGMQIATAGGMESESSVAHEVYDSRIGTAAYFMGLVDNTGANSIDSFLFGKLAFAPGYYFDSQTSFVAVPEPGSTAAVALLAGVWAAGRRRRKRRQSKARAFSSFS